MSSKGIAMSEKHADIEFGVESRAGIPFHFLMRDVIQFDNSLEDAIRCVMCVWSHCTLITVANDITGVSRRLTGHAPYG